MIQFLIIASVAIFVLVFKDKLVDQHCVNLNHQLKIVNDQLATCKNPEEIEFLKQERKRIKFEIELCDVDG